HAFDQDQNLVQPVLDSARVDEDLLHTCPRTRHVHYRHGKALGEDAIVTRSVKPFADIQLFLVLHVLDFAIGGAPASERAPDMVLLRNHTCGKTGVGDESKLRAYWICGESYTHNPIGS